EAKDFFDNQGSHTVSLKLDPAPVSVPAGTGEVSRPVVSGASGIVVPDLSPSAGQSSEDGRAFSIGAILIDPGHGGKDPGASATFTVKGKKVSVVEKNINLKIALKLYDMLTKAYPKKRILMTRNTDKYLSLEERTDIANSVKLGENEAVLYLSVHVNASLDKSATGFEVWYLSPGYRRQVIDGSTSEDKSLLTILNSMMEEEYTTESILMAKFIEDGINAQVGSLSPRRGIKEEEWFVVRNAKMPSVLVETGFLSNEQEAALLSDDDYLKKLSLGIYNGLGAFITHFERSRGFTGN
ncbi:MAG: N-acetylmuramoyl-L-alanine amidase, partial [Treponema sp.]|nr:N-acetylmuramoyl-L-alanine amidase [Treponema sp.]